MKLDWNTIDTVLLDMDGTLLDLHFDNHFWREHMPQVWADRKGLNLEQAALELEPLFQTHEGTLNWYCVEFWSEELELDIMALKREVAGKIKYRPNAELFLGHCRQQVNDLRLITNAHRKVLELKNELTQLDQYFDQMHSSHELHYPKENREFWLELQKIRSFDPLRTLFVDDSESVLRSAKQYGIAHVYSIEQPDSERLREQASQFPMIGDFINIV